MKRYCEECGKKLKLLRQEPAENYLRINTRLMQIPYPKFDRDTGKRAYFTLYACPDYREEKYGFLCKKIRSNEHDIKVDKGNLEKLFEF